LCCFSHWSDGFGFNSSFSAIEAVSVAHVAVAPVVAAEAFAPFQFYKKDNPLAESGLIGPVRLMR
jgi:hypothetical protein